MLRWKSMQVAPTLILSITADRIRINSPVARSYRNMPKPLPVGCGASQEAGFGSKLPTYTKVFESGSAAVLASGGNMTAAVIAGVDLMRDLRLILLSLGGAPESLSDSCASLPIFAMSSPASEWSMRQKTAAPVRSYQSLLLRETSETVPLVLWMKSRHFQ
jgi:hypothetical protein